MVDTLGQPLLSETTLATYAEHLGAGIARGAANFNVFGWEVGTRDAAVLILIFLVSAMVGGGIVRVFPHEFRDSDARDR